MAVGKTEVHALFRGVVQFVWRRVIAQHVASIVREPQCVCVGMPIETHRVANAAREDLETAPIRIHAE